MHDGPEEVYLDQFFKLIAILKSMPNIFYQVIFSSYVLMWTVLMWKYSQIHMHNNGPEFRPVF